MVLEGKQKIVFWDFGEAHKRNSLPLKLKLRGRVSGTKFWNFITIAQSQVILKWIALKEMNLRGNCQI